MVRSSQGREWDKLRPGAVKDKARSSQGMGWGKLRPGAVREGQHLHPPAATVLAATAASAPHPCRTARRICNGG